MTGFDAGVRSYHSIKFVTASFLPKKQECLPRLLQLKDENDKMEAGNVQHKGVLIPFEGTFAPYYNIDFIALPALQQASHAHCSLSSKNFGFIIQNSPQQ